MPAFALPFSYTPFVTPGAPLWFPARYAEANLVYQLDIAAAVLSSDYPVRATASLAPSGAGEMQIAQLSVLANQVSVLPTGGQPGRVYTYDVTVTMGNGNVYSFSVQQGVLKPLPTDAAQVAPTPGFGPEIVWMAGSNNVVSTSVGANLVLSNAPCAVANIQANIGGVGGFVMLFDSATVPADGAVTWARCWKVSANSTLLPQLFEPPLTMARGAVLAFSSNADQFTLTSSSTATFAGQLV